MATLGKLEHLIENIRLSIFDGDFQAGSTISERKIAEHYQVSRGTARKALMDLESRGFLRLKKSVGYQVLSRRMDPLVEALSTLGPKLRVYSEKTGHQYEEVEDISVGHATEEAVRGLRLINSSSTVVSYKVKRYDTRSEKLITYVEYFFPESEYYHAEQDVTKVPLQILKRSYDKLWKVEAVLKLIEPSKDIFDLLKSDDNQIVSKRESTYLLKDKSVLCWSAEYMLPEDSVSILPAPTIYKKVGGFIE